MKLTGKRSLPTMKSSRKFLLQKMMTSNLWVASLHRGSDGGLGTVLLALALMLV
jgi:hypothetical protein